MEPYLEFIGTLQNSGFGLVQAIASVTWEAQNTANIWCRVAVSIAPPQWYGPPPQP